MTDPLPHAIAQCDIEKRHLGSQGRCHEPGKVRISLRHRDPEPAHDRLHIRGTFTGVVADGHVLEPMVVLDQGEGVRVDCFEVDSFFYIAGKGVSPAAHDQALEILFDQRGFEPVRQLLSVWPGPTINVDHANRKTLFAPDAGELSIQFGRDAPSGGIGFGSIDGRQGPPDPDDRKGMGDIGGNPAHILQDLPRRRT
jgi:hypothetical protein